jgi:hypothetical protein
MPDPDPQHFLRMARHMKASAEEVKAAILKTQAAGHGVVALRFSNAGRNMEIEVLDEPFEPNVRVYPGD